MKIQKTLRITIMAAGMLIGGNIYGETQPCSILSVNISDRKVLNIEVSPGDARVTYTITLADAVPVSGTSGLTIDLTGKYHLVCRAWTQTDPQSETAAYDINWQEPQFQTTEPTK